MCIRELVFILIMTGVMIVALWIIMPVRKEMNMKKANLEQLKIENAALDKELRELRKEYTRLENKDPYSLLRVARETYDYCFPNEKIYQFPKHSSHTDADMLPTDTLQPSTN